MPVAGAGLAGSLFVPAVCSFLEQPSRQTTETSARYKRFVINLIKRVRVRGGAPACCSNLVTRSRPAKTATGAGAIRLSGQITMIPESVK